MISKLAEFILNHIEDLNLKEVLHNHLIDDNHKIYDKRIPTETFNPYDRFIYSVALARSYALNNKYSDAFKYYKLANQELENNDFDLHSVSFFKINRAISLGYLGRYYGDNDSSRDEIKNLLSHLESNSEFIDDAIMYTVNLSDIALYSRLRGLKYHIKHNEELIKKYPDRINKRKFIYLRLGTLYLFQYIASNNIKDCMASEKYFLQEIKSSDKNDYRHYWAKCGYVICQYHLNKKVDNNYLDNPPSDYRSKALPWPSILYILVKAKNITGDFSWVNALLRTIERKIQKQIQDLPDDYNYQNLIINKYKMILDEWINIIFNDYENKSIGDQEICKRLIKVHEISKYRVLSEKLQYSNEKYRNNLTNILEHIENKKLGKHILYLSDEIHSISGKSFFFMIYIDIKNNIFNLKKYDGLIIDKICKSWQSIVINGEKNQVFEMFLRDIIKTLELSKILENPSQTMVIANKIISNIPLPMLSGFKNSFSYWPNLSVPSRIQVLDDIEPSMDIYYDPHEKNAQKEVDAIADICSDYNPSINKINNSINSKSSMVHCVCHFDGNNITINDKSIHYKDFFKNISKNNKVIILNMCQGSSNLIKNNIYDSLPLYLILKGVQTIICHRWDLGQKASIGFSKNYYQNLIKTCSISDAFNQSLKDMKNYNMSEYGGYILWGNSKLRINNAS